MVLNSKARQFEGLLEIDDVGDPVYLFGEPKRSFLRSQIALLWVENIQQKL